MKINVNYIPTLWIDTWGFFECQHIETQREDTEVMIGFDPRIDGPAYIEEVVEFCNECREVV